MSEKGIVVNPFARIYSVIIFAINFLTIMKESKLSFLITVVSVSANKIIFISY